MGLRDRLEKANAAAKAAGEQGAKQRQKLRDQIKSDRAAAREARKRRAANRAKARASLQSRPARQVDREQLEAERAANKARREELKAERRQAAQQRQEARADALARRPVSFSGVRLCDGTITYKRESHPVAGVTATVETAAEIDRRLSLTRTAGGALLLGPLGAVLGGIAKKKVDTSQAFLLIEGPEFAWAVEVPLGKGKARAKSIAQTREFAAKITTAGKRASASS